MGQFDGKFYWPSEEYSTPADNHCWHVPPSPNADFKCVRRAEHPGKHHYEHSPDLRNYSHKDAFTMPIINTRLSVTWKPTREDRETAMANHCGQSLEKLADRQGVDWTELDAIVANEPYRHHPRDADTSMKRVNLILRQRAGV